MQANIRQRVIGALVLIALIAIFLPLFFTGKHNQKAMEQKPPMPPAMPRVSLKLPPLPNDAAINPSQLVAVPVKQQQAAQTQVASTKPAVEQQIMQLHGLKQLPKSTQSKSQVAKKVTAWRLKLGTFSYEVNSKKLLKLLKKHGFDGYEHKISLANNKHAYQVYIGPAMNLIEAQTVQKHLLKALGMPALIVKASKQGVK